MYIERYKWTSLAGIIAIFAIIPITALSEPYTIKKGDTLGKIARDHGTTVAVLLAANKDSLASADKIKVDQVIVIPEDASNFDSSSRPAADPHPADLRPADLRPADLRPADDTKGPKVAQANRESQDVITLQKGISEKNWVVTQNPATGKIFVHERDSGGILENMRYVITEKDGTWTLYRPGNRARAVGVMNRPDVSIAECGCQ